MSRPDSGLLKQAPLQTCDGAHKPLSRLTEISLGLISGGAVMLCIGMSRHGQSLAVLAMRALGRATPSLTPPSSDCPPQSVFDLTPVGVRATVRVECDTVGCFAVQGRGSQNHTLHAQGNMHVPSEARSLLPTHSFAHCPVFFSAPLFGCMGHYCWGTNVIGATHSAQRSTPVFSVGASRNATAPCSGLTPLSSSLAGETRVATLLSGKGRGGGERAGGLKGGAHCCKGQVPPPPPLSFPTPCRSPGGGGGPSLGQPKIFRCGSLCCCVGDCIVGHCHLYPSACACQASYQEGKTTTQECCPKHSSGKWRACARVQGEVEQDQEILHRAGQGVGLRTWTAL